MVNNDTLFSFYRFELLFWPYVIALAIMYLSHTEILSYTVVIGMFYRLYMVDEIFNYFLQISKCVLFDSFPGNVWWKFRNCETMKWDCHIFIVKGRLLCWAILLIDIVIVDNTCFSSVSPHHKISTIADTNTDCFLILHMYIIFM